MQEGWRRELQRRVQAELIARSGTRDAGLLQTAYEAFLSAIDTAAPVDVESADSSEDKPQARTMKGVEDTPKSTTHNTGNSPSVPASSAVSTGLTAHSENIRWADRVLRKTRVLDLEPAYAGAIVNVPSLEQLNADGSASPLPDEFDDADAAATRQAYGGSPELCWVPPRFAQAQQMRAQLRACVGLSHENSYDAGSKARMAALRKASRAFVYDMRKYQPSTLWGPYRTGADGRTVLVNWEHVEHILNVVGLKLREIPISSLGFFKKPLFQMDALRAYSAVGSAQRPEGDWAGVTGTWRRFVCFMDYR